MTNVTMMTADMKNDYFQEKEEETTKNRAGSNLVDVTEITDVKVVQTAICLRICHQACSPDSLKEKSLELNLVASESVLCRREIDKFKAIIAE